MTSDLKSEYLFYSRALDLDLKAGCRHGTDRRQTTGNAIFDDEDNL